MTWSRFASAIFCGRAAPGRRAGSFVGGIWTMRDAKGQRIADLRGARGATTSRSASFRSTFRGPRGPMKSMHSVSGRLTLLHHAGISTFSRSRRHQDSNFRESCNVLYPELSNPLFLSSWERSMHDISPRSGRTEICRRPCRAVFRVDLAAPVFSVRRHESCRSW
jgi:hypothetical protein